MKQTIINLKQRIDENYEAIQKKYLLSKILLEKINTLIDTDASNAEIKNWLENNDNLIFGLEYNLNQIEKKSDFKDKIRSLIEKIETYKKDLQDDPILIETTLNVLRYLLMEDISNEQKKSMLNNIKNTTKFIEEKIDKIENSI